MLDGSVNIISFGGTNIAISTMVADFKMLGYDRRGDMFPTKSLAVLSEASQSSWRQITANGVNIICTPATLFWIGTGWKAAGDLVVSTDSIYGLSGTTTYNFGALPHATAAANYRTLFQSFMVTANNSHSQTATAYQLRTSVGRYFANRFVVRDEFYIVTNRLLLRFLSGGAKHGNVFLALQGLWP